MLQTPGIGTRPEDTGLFTLFAIAFLNRIWLRTVNTCLIGPSSETAG